MHKKPFFSVIIPTLNEERFLPRLLDDLCKQTHRDFEVLVVDGGSGDRTVARAKHYANRLSQLRVIPVAKQSPSLQRNRGAQTAKGEYLIFFDADVQIPSDFLQAVAATCAGGAVFVTTYVRADSTVVSDEAYVELTNLVIELARLIGKPFAVGANTIVRRDVFLQVGGFDERIRHAEDYSFTQTVKQAGYPLTILRQPRLVLSLRRYRVEGRLTVVRKHAAAMLHVLTRGPITRDLFSYQMGGKQYARLRKQPRLSTQAKKFLEHNVRKVIDELFS